MGRELKETEKLKILNLKCKSADNQRFMNLNERFPKTTHLGALQNNRALH